jgi:hypothetical protein
MQADLRFHCRTVCPRLSGILSLKIVEANPFLQPNCCIQRVCLFLFAREDVAKQLLFRKPIRAAGKIGHDPRGPCEKYWRNQNYRAGRGRSQTAGTELQQQ